jgi:FkbM family methyltransferase
MKKLIRKISNKISHEIGRLARIKIPLYPIEKPITPLGSKSNTWFVFTPIIKKNGVMISAGLGEDVSFEIELTSTHDIRTILIDPTPKSVLHYKEIQERFGMGKNLPYTNDGRQSVFSYDLRNINSHNLSLYEFALWNETLEDIKFYLPPNRDDVSHSILNIHNNYSTLSEYITVKTITFVNIITVEKINYEIDILKLDIEGSEVEVIRSVIDSGILPKQILIEIDEYYFINIYSRRRVRSLLNGLCSHYYCIHRKDSNFVFIRRDLV